MIHQGRGFDVFTVNSTARERKKDIKETGRVREAEHGKQSKCPGCCVGHCTISGVAEALCVVGFVVLPSSFLRLLRAILRPFFSSSSSFSLSRQFSFILILLLILLLLLHRGPLSSSSSARQPSRLLSILPRFVITPIWLPVYSNLLGRLDISDE